MEVWDILDAHRLRVGGSMASYHRTRSLGLVRRCGLTLALLPSNWNPGAQRKMRCVLNPPCRCSGSGEEEGV